MRAGQRIERAERFIEQQHLRLHRECAGDADTLLHAARQLAGIFADGVAQADEIDDLARAHRQPGFALGRGKHALDGEVDILEHRQPGQQRVVLKHHGAFRTGAVDLAILEQHAALRRQQQAGDQIQHR